MEEWEQVISHLVMGVGSQMQLLIVMNAGPIFVIDLNTICAPPTHAYSGLVGVCLAERALCDERTNEREQTKCSTQRLSTYVDSSRDAYAGALARSEPVREDRRERDRGTRASFRRRAA